MLLIFDFLGKAGGILVKLNKIFVSIFWFYKTFTPLLLHSISFLPWFATRPVNHRHGTSTESSKASWPHVKSQTGGLFLSSHIRLEMCYLIGLHYIRYSWRGIDRFEDKGAFLTLLKIRKFCPLNPWSEHLDPLFIRLPNPRNACSVCYCEFIFFLHDNFFLILTIFFIMIIFFYLNYFSKLFSYS